MWLLKEGKNKCVPSCDSVVHTRGACCVKERFVLVWSEFIRTPSTRFRFIAPSGGAPPASPVPFTPALGVVTCKSNTRHTEEKSALGGAGGCVGKRGGKSAGGFVADLAWFSLTRSFPTLPWSVSWCRRL